MVAPFTEAPCISHCSKHPVWSKVVLNSNIGHQPLGKFNLLHWLYKNLKAHKAFCWLEFLITITHYNSKCFAKSGSPIEYNWNFFNFLKLGLSTLASLVRKLLLIQPTSAASERDFSLLSTLSSQQDNALEDYIEASVMITCNECQRKAWIFSLLLLGLLKDKEPWSASYLLYFLFENEREIFIATASTS